MSSKPTHTTGQTSGGALRRVLSLPALIFFGLVYMVPLTVFTTYGIVTKISGGRTATAYMVTLLVMLFTALSYSFMVRKYPIAGSAYSYSAKSFGANIGFLTGWSLLLDYLFLPMINYLVIGIYLNLSFPQIPAGYFIVGMISLVTVLNVLGIQSVSRFSNVLVGAQIIFIVVFVALAWKTISGQPMINLSAPFLGDGSTSGMAPVFAGAAVLCLSFLGFDAVSTMAEEAKEARRDIPLAIILTTVGAGLLFILLSFVSQLAYPSNAFKDVDVAANEVMLAASGQFLMVFFTAAYVAGAAGSALASQASVSRILYTMGRDRVLPEGFFAKVSYRFGTPILSILFVSVASLLALVISLETLASLISFGALVAFSAVNLAVIKTYLIDQKAQSVFSYFYYGLLPLTGFALIVWLWTSLSALTLKIGIAWFVLGVIYLGVLRMTRRQPELALEEPM